MQYNRVSLFRDLLLRVDMERHGLRIHDPLTMHAPKRTLRRPNARVQPPKKKNAMAPVSTSASGDTPPAVSGAVS